MLAEMTWGQFMEWQMYAELEPFGEQRGDLRSGILASLIANTNRDPRRNPRAYTATDFMPFYEANTRAERKPLTSTEAWRSFKKITMAISKAR